MRLYVATTNPGKLRDLAHAAEGHLVAGEPITIQPLAQLAEIPAPPEDEPTFEGNARAKAIYYSRHAPDALLLADDSGLEVMCLEDAPGVRSARYAEDQAQALGFPLMPAATLDERNNFALLRGLDGVPEHCRRARYRCVLVFVAGPADPAPATAEGVWEGCIVDSPRGSAGFGYDPHFWLPDLRMTAAELDPAEKNRRSHRGMALRALRERLLARELSAGG